MATLITLDTCGCQILVDREGEATKHVFVCARHKLARFDHRAVHAEHRSKNACVSELGATAPGLVVAWAFGQDGVLRIRAPLVTANPALAAIVRKHGGIVIE